jgi:hypothetical protein
VLERVALVPALSEGTRCIGLRHTREGLSQGLAQVLAVIESKRCIGLPHTPMPAHSCSQSPAWGLPVDLATAWRRSSTLPPIHRPITCCRILNRFSGDVGTVDSKLPVAFSSFLVVALRVFATMVR